MDLLLLIGGILTYSLFDFFAARASVATNPYLAAVIFNGIGAVLPLGIYIALRLHGGPDLKVTNSGIVDSVLAGISVGIFSILLVLILQHRGISIGIPLLYGSSILLAAVMGWLILREPVSWVSVAGVTLVSFGLFLVVRSGA